MLRKCFLAVALIAIVACLVVSRLVAEQKPLVHPLFTDHRVLQRELPAPIWGWGASPGLAAGEE